MLLSDVLIEGDRSDSVGKWFDGTHAKNVYCGKQSRIANLTLRIQIPSALLLKYLLICCFLFSASRVSAQWQADSVKSGLYVKVGLASYYANKFHGRRTTSGEKYHKNKFTAAHRTLPFGTKVKVTSLKNKKWVIVRINDRGPHNKKRIIDLSYRAAKHLGITNGKGLAKVRVEEIPVQPKPGVEN